MKNETRHPPRVLLTGFGPFPGVAENATERLVPSLAAALRERRPDTQIRFDILATEWDRAPAQIAAVADEFDPSVVLHFGVSERARGFVVERTARNARNVTPDACDVIAASEFILDEGPEAFTSTFPADAIVARLAALGVPAMISDDAGRYLCNAVLYHSLHRAAAVGRSQAIGFVHVPADLGQTRSALNWDTAVHGGLEILEVCLGVSRKTV